jgi:hypothetical protein
MMKPSDFAFFAHHSLDRQFPFSYYEALGRIQLTRETDLVHCFLQPFLAAAKQDKWTAFGKRMRTDQRLQKLFRRFFEPAVNRERFGSDIL